MNAKNGHHAVSEDCQLSMEGESIGCSGFSDWLSPHLSVISMYSPPHCVHTCPQHTTKCEHLQKLDVPVGARNGAVMDRQIRERKRAAH
eukprot:4293587-Amphidinium_carterae.1